MPITTPEFVKDKYNGDKDHFRHVLDHLFIPAVTAAGMNPVPPIAQGSDIIQGEIIKHVQTADFVLCDMSILNPNVFFELGMRTAVNKPIALVKDEVTDKIPFDVSMVNNHTYQCPLELWTISEEVKKLKNHLLDCIKKSGDGMTLWDYFGLSSHAEPIKADGGVGEKVDYLARQVEAMRQESGQAKSGESIGWQDEFMFQEIKRIANEAGDTVYRIKREQDTIWILSEKYLSDMAIREIQDFLKIAGLKLSVSTLLMK
ncbi:MAG: hypothetical protein GY841_20325 [FCB group bacterium]|nr:hypothetical protein [FCB group bacterium]